MTSPFVMVIFGATGDLTKSKLIPALFSLFKKHILPKDFYILGFARREFSDVVFREMLMESFRSNDTYQYNDWVEFRKHIFYQQGMFDKVEGYDKLMQKLNLFDKERSTRITRFFYLATPPSNYNSILDMLNQTKLSKDINDKSNNYTRIIVEKPFGKDIQTARHLDQKLSQLFKEHQIFRVDHYLGKETVQNILVFRFANNIFEPVWDKNYIDHVQITWAETKGIEGRGAFFDGVGLLRDVAQNHLMQLLAAVVMEQPKSFSKEGVRDARAKAIEAIQCINPEEVPKYVVRGQYQGYQNEKDVTKDSSTETFIAMKLFVDTPRFLGVPFYLRAGKKMAKNVVEISIVFLQTCHILFKEIGCPEEGNVLTFRIQPDEGIGLHVIAKKPGTKLKLRTADMKFSYKSEFGTKGTDAYEKLLVDIFEGDQMLFNRSDELESSWDFITKILEGWEKNKAQVDGYEPGEWGPKGANDLIEKDARGWI